MKRGLLPYLMIIFVTVIGLTNFFLPILDHNQKTDPLITYAFIGLASTIAVGKGIAALLPGSLKKSDDATGKEGVE